MTSGPSDRFVRVHLGILLAVTVLAAWRSDAYFHLDEYFQTIEFARLKLGTADAWMLPWEYGERMRPWLQPAVYVVLGKACVAFGVSGIFAQAFVFRLVTGLFSWFAVVRFLRTSLPWFSPAEQETHVRAVTLAGFLPYLFVRTSSETASMVAIVLGFSLLCAGARANGKAWAVPARSHARGVGVGALFGLAFDLRFQSAFFVLPLLLWLLAVAHERVRALGSIALGAFVVLVLGVLVDRWGYGAWTLSPWNYFKNNILEGAAGVFGSEPPFAYLWILPANLFGPVVALLLGLAVVAWARAPRHPITWTTLPFFVVHNILPHKEERFLFPLAIFATAFLTMAMAPSLGPSRLAAWLWARRRGVGARIFVVFNLAVMLLLASTSIGWQHHVRFEKAARAFVGEDFRVEAPLDFPIGLPAFHGKTYDVEKLPPAELARRLHDGTARPWLVADRPSAPTGDPHVDDRARLVYTEVPFWEASPALASLFLRATEAYDAHVRPPLRAIRYRSLYSLR